MSDFALRPFVAGSLIGMRAFIADHEGVLIGPAYAAPFLSGENEAQCLRGADSLRHFLPPRLSSFEPVGTRKPHRSGGMQCSCGFYAYFAGGNDFANSWNVQGLIEGYGTATVGSRGFRASNARLVALVNPYPALPRLPFSRADKISVGSAAWCAAFGVWDLFHVWWLAPLMLACVIFNLSALHFARRSRGRLRYNSLVGRSAWEKVRSNYPDVPVYDSLTDAIAAHPLTIPEPASKAKEIAS